MTDGKIDQELWRRLADYEGSPAEVAVQLAAAAELAEWYEHEIDTLRDDLAQSDASIDKLIAERDEAERQRDAKRAECDTLHSLLANRHTDALEHIGSLKRQLEIARQAIKQHEQAASKDWTLFAELRDDREQWREGYHNARRQLDTAQAEIARLRDLVVIGHP